DLLSALRDLLSALRDLVGGLEDLLGRRGLFRRTEREELWDALEGPPQRIERRRGVQRCRWVIQRIQANGPRADHAHLLAAVEPRDSRRVAAQQLRGEVSERADHDRFDQVHLAAQVPLTRLDLVR